MRKLYLYIALSFLIYISCLTNIAYSQTSTFTPPGMLTTEEDGSPDLRCIKYTFANGNVTDNGNGTCSIADGGGGSSEWTDTGTILHPTDSSGTLDSVVIGGTTAANSDIHLGVTGTAQFNIQGTNASDFVIYQQDGTVMFYSDSDAGAVGRIGIGTDTPLATLHIEDRGAGEGDIRVEGDGIVFGTLDVGETSGGNGVYRQTSQDLNPFTIISLRNDGHEMMELRGSDSGAATDTSHILLTLPDSANNIDEFARFSWSSGKGNTSGNEQGSIFFDILKNGSVVEALEMNNTEIIFNEENNDLNFTIDGTTLTAFKVFADKEVVEISGAIDIGEVETFVDADTTPNVESGSYWQTNTTGVTITDFDGADIVDGQLLYVISKGAIVYDCTTSGFQCGSTDITTASGDVTVWEYDGTDWHLLSFKDQSADMGSPGGGGGVGNSLDTEMVWNNSGTLDGITNFTYDTANDDLDAADGFTLDLSAINQSANTEGFKVPQHTTNCTNATQNGQVCWDTDDNLLYVGNGTAAELFIKTGTLTDTNFCVYDAAGDEIDCNNAGGAATAYDNIGDPSGNGSIAFGANTGTYTSATNGWGGLIVSNTVADMTTDGTLINLIVNDDSDTNSAFIELTNDADGATPDKLRLRHENGSFKMHTDDTLQFQVNDQIFFSDLTTLAMTFGLSTTQAELEIGLDDDTGNQLVITTFANIGNDHDHAAQTDPTLFIHSDTDPDTANDEWIGITHNKTNASFTRGSGTFLFDADLDVTGDVGGTTIGGITEANLVDKSASEAITGSWDFGGAAGLEIPNGTNPTVDTLGEIALDTTGTQVVIQGSSNDMIIPYSYSKCGTWENLAAADDDQLYLSFPDNSTLINAWCHCSGTCTTEADISFETVQVGTGGPTVDDVSGTVDCEDLIAGDTVTPLGGTGSTVDAIDVVRFDVDNAVSPETDEYQICIEFVVDRQ